MLAFFRGLSIRSRLLLSYTLTFTCILVVSFTVIYSMVKSTLEANIESELGNFTHIIHGMVEAAIDASIKNHLRSRAEGNLEIITRIYHQSQAGEISEQKARELATDILLSQTVGKSGYVYCIDSKGITRVHPLKEMIGKDVSNYDFIQKTIRKKQGYIEYNWANPGETNERAKATYLCYFAPWDWIIGVSSYRHEFNRLVSVDDFKDNILSLTFGKTGYPYIMDSKGLLIIHPKLEGTNIYNSTDENGRMFIKEICEEKNGKIIYPWKNPGDPTSRNKLVIFNYIPELDWIVASSSYLEEFYSPLKRIGMFTLIAAAVMFPVVIIVTWLISSMLARPLQEMISVFGSGGQLEYSQRMEVRWGGEMDRVAENYNRFIDKLQRTRRRLLESEEKFRGIFENSIEGICQIAKDGKLVTINPAMARIFGYESTQVMLKEITNLAEQQFKDATERKEMLKLLYSNGYVTEYEAEFFKRDKTAFWCSLSARAYKDDNNEIQYFDAFFTDITKRKESEEDLKKSHIELEHRVMERTSELSSWVSELERVNSENALFRTMSEMIQVCSTSPEIYRIAHQYIQKFFEGTSGRLLEYDKASNTLFPVVTWGSPKGDDNGFSPDECWALRQGKPYYVDKDENALYCPHFQGTVSSDSLCVPMTVRGEILGLLYAVNDKKSEEPEVAGASGNGKIHELPRKKEIGTTIAEHIAMALVNIRLQESLKQKSIVDPLTGLHNRRFMDETLKLEASRMVRNKHKIGIIMMDVDHFKKFNDDHGHDCGDAVLKSLGQLLKKNTRGEDISCRYGGEEFIAILINTTLRGLHKKAEDLCKKVRESLIVKHKGQSYRVTISLGAALCPTHAVTLDETLKMADEALYTAKNEGRNRACMARIDHEIEEDE